MGSLQGFRPPQFSEDLAWLPPWLQHPQLEFQTPSVKPLQESMFPNPCISNVIDVDISPSEESRHHCSQLFLSGEDNFPNSISASSGQVLHLCLRLSSDGESQCNQSQHLYTSQVLHGSTSGLSSLQLKTSASLGENMHHSKGPHNGGASTISPLTSIPTTGGNDALRCPENDKEKLDSDPDGKHLLLPTSISATVENNGLLFPSSCHHTRRESEEKSNVRHMSDGDLDDTVGISVAASEALVIHELMKSESSAEVLSSRAILEAALLVKQARLEALDHAYCCASNASSEVDSLSDLNDSIMADAFQDVGLSLRGLDNDQEPKPVQLLTQHDKSCDDSTLGVKDTQITCLAETFVHHPAEGILHDLPLEMLEVDLHSSHACIPESAEAEDNIHYPVANRFRSRWLGGWTAKEVDSPTIPKFFVETSSLSESADIAPDNNSVVEKHETFKITSQSSILFEGLQDKADEGVFISLEFRSSNLSPIDPLCSIVPCSISPENVGSPLAKNQNDRGVEAEDCCTHKAPPGMKDLQRTSDLDLGSVHVDDKGMPPGNFFGAPVQRYLASLKTYSTLLPKQDSTLEGNALQGDWQIPSEDVSKLLSLDQDMGCFRVVNQGNSKENLSFGYKFECAKGNKERQDTSVIRNLVTDTSKRNCNEHGKDGSELHLQPLVQKKSPLILNKRRRCCLEGSESNPVWAMAEDSIMKFQNLQSNSKVPHKSQNPVGKRVCFPKVDAELQPCKDLQKRDTSLRNRSINRASKRSKFSNSKFDSRNQDLRDCSGHIEGGSILIFCGLDFLLTGFSSRKEREIIRLIQKYGGFVLVDIPSPPNSRAKRISKSSQQLPIVICSKKLQTTKFLYGCAVNTLILNKHWLTDSAAAGYALPPGKYMILSNQANLNCTKIQKSVRQGDWEGIFEGVGIMLHGQHNFCTKLAMIIKHGGGHVFRTLQMLLQSLDTKKTSVGAIVAEGESRASRHLKHCASERKIPVVSASWVTKSLHLGQLLPFEERWKTLLATERPESAAYMDWSEEI